MAKTMEEDKNPELVKLFKELNAKRVQDVILRSEMDAEDLYDVLTPIDVQGDGFTQYWATHDGFETLKKLGYVVKDEDTDREHLRIRSDVLDGLVAGEKIQMLEHYPEDDSPIRFVLAKEYVQPIEKPRETYVPTEINASNGFYEDKLENLFTKFEPLEKLEKQMAHRH